MIDRRARDQAANAVAAFWSGEITNRQLEERWPDSRDRAVIAVESFIWLLYDDFKRHRVCDADRGDANISIRIHACLDFLRSSQEYAWPHLATPNYNQPIYPRWKVVASLGLLAISNYFAARSSERYWREMNAAGDVSAWPFLQHQFRPE